MNPRPRHLLVLALALLIAGCSTVYYSVWETLGQEKRDLLRSNVEAVREDQEEVGEQFENALEKIRALYGLEDAGKLENQYDKVKSAYEKSVSRADALRERIDKVEEIGSDLFAEWRRELDDISDPQLRQRSREQLTATRERFGRLTAALARTESKLDPVLERFEDQVLFLKHSLNAAAVGSLEAEGAAISRDVARLIEDLQSSIKETDAFIRALPA